MKQIDLGKKFNIVLITIGLKFIINKNITAVQVFITFLFSFFKKLENKLF